MFLLIKLKCNGVKGILIIKFIKKKNDRDVKGWKRITAYPWCDGHSTSISACGVWEARARVQVSRRELHTHAFRLG